MTFTASITVEAFLTRRVREGASTRTAIREARAAGFSIGNDRARAIANLARNKDLTARQRQAITPRVRGRRIKIDQVSGAIQGVNVTYTAVQRFATTFDRSGSLATEGEAVIKGTFFVPSTRPSVQRSAVIEQARRRGLEEAIARSRSILGVRAAYTTTRPTSFVIDVTGGAIVG